MLTIGEKTRVPLVLGRVAFLQEQSWKVTQMDLTRVTLQRQSLPLASQISKEVVEQRHTWRQERALRYYDTVLADPNADEKEDDNDADGNADDSAKNNWKRNLLAVRENNKRKLKEMDDVGGHATVMLTELVLVASTPTPVNLCDNVNTTLCYIPCAESDIAPPLALYPELTSVPLSELYLTYEIPPVSESFVHLSVYQTQVAISYGQETLIINTSDGSRKLHQSTKILFDAQGERLALVCRNDHYNVEHGNKRGRLQTPYDPSGDFQYLDGRLYGLQKDATYDGHDEELHFRTWNLAGNVLAVHCLQGIDLAGDTKKCFAPLPNGKVVIAAHINHDEVSGLETSDESFSDEFYLLCYNLHTCKYEFYSELPKDFHPVALRYRHPWLVLFSASGTCLLADINNLGSTLLKTGDSFNLDLQSLDQTKPLHLADAMFDGDLMFLWFNQGRLVVQADPLLLRQISE